MYEPNAFIVPGFNPAMPPINQPPIGLTDQEILCVIAYLQTLGGTPTVTLQTNHHYYSGAAAPGGRQPRLLRPRRRAPGAPSPQAAQRPPELQPPARSSRLPPIRRRRLDGAAR